MPFAMPSSGRNFYARILRPLLFRLDPETAHRLTIAVLSLMPPLPRAADASQLATTVFGVSFANPIGLAAGVDKDARAIAGWNALGFGFAELGTITPRPQPGNPRPRMWRLPEHRALINRLGFPGQGMEVASARLVKLGGRRPAMRVGLNFGPNKDTPADRVAADYAMLAGRLAPLADFVVVNLSSPNTPGLREWQAPERMRAVVEAVRGAAAAGVPRTPILIKIAPDLEPLHLREICAAASDLAIDGIVATNTTLKRGELGVPSALAGGLSGAPMRALARTTIARIYHDTHGRIPIIGVGGVANADEAYGHFCAGASLVEFYTAMVYGGPGLVRAIKRGLVDLLARDGFRSISEAVGSAADR
ncbi:MAG: quinone-dependent dihydroorotate dehydrogenase [Candidatus Binataceae bacterium]|nr:quinone-dependent dihydroorotate dehydrogenase [Candidatus Binataceae bacterium]